MYMNLRTYVPPTLSQNDLLLLFGSNPKSEIVLYEKKSEGKAEEKKKIDLSGKEAVFYIQIQSSQT